VVDAIDRLAYQNHTNRSNLVNQILAEYVSYETPEKRNSEVFDRIESLLGSVFQVAEAATPTTLTLRSSLSYKYNPTVRYQVEMYRTHDVAVGELKVSMRTQNATLSLLVGQFFKLWARIERAYHPETRLSLTDGKFVKLFVTDLSSSAAIGEGISAYIDAFDHALKSFFYLLDEPERAAEEVERTFLAADLPL
jgi:hypothetical protein